MGRTKKTPPHIKDLLQRHLDQVEWLEECLDVKSRVPVENQAEHIKRLTPEFVMGKIEGMNCAVEDALHAYGCYAGFTYRARPVTSAGITYRDFVGPHDPRYAEYRRYYHHTN